MDQIVKYFEVSKLIVDEHCGFRLDSEHNWDYTVQYVITNNTLEKMVRCG